MSPHLGRLLDDMTVVERVSPTDAVQGRARAARANSCEVRGRMSVGS